MVYSINKGDIRQKVEMLNVQDDSVQGGRCQLYLRTGLHPSTHGNYSQSGQCVMCIQFAQLPVSRAYFVYCVFSVNSIQCVL